MVTKVIRLTVISGPHKGSKYCFRGKSCCTVGRASDCFVQLTGAKKRNPVSRHHCLFEVDVPFIRVTDLESKNGTYINGEKIEPGQPELQVCGPSCCDCSNRILKDGDILQIGRTTFKVDLMNCPPRFERDEPDPPIWKPGEILKKNCNILC